MYFSCSFIWMLTTKRFVYGIQCLTIHIKQCYIVSSGIVHYAAQNGYKLLRTEVDNTPHFTPNTLNPSEESEFPRGPITTPILVTSSSIQKWLWPGLFVHKSVPLKA